MRKFNYITRVITEGFDDSILERELNALGNIGWELIFIKSQNTATGTIYSCVFKREL